MKKYIEKLDKKYCIEEVDTTISELQFALLQIEYLLSVLNEIESISDTLQKKIIDNAKERHYLDKLIHAKLLFK